MWKRTNREGDIKTQVAPPLPAPSGQRAGRLCPTLTPAQFARFATDGRRRHAVALAGDPTLDRFAGRVSDSGEGRGTPEAAIDEAVPANGLAAALFGRFTSRGEADFQDRLLSAMRFEFGGHVEQ